MSELQTVAQGQFREPCSVLPRVVVTHPARQHVHQTVLASVEAGFLCQFITSIFDHTGPISHPLVSPICELPWLRERLRRYYHPDIPVDLVSIYPESVMLERFWKAIAGTSFGLVPEPKVGWGDYRFDLAAADWMRRTPVEFNVLHAFEGGALQTLASAQNSNVRTVLEAPSAHEYFLATDSRERGCGVEKRYAWQTARLRAERKRADVVLAPSEYVKQCLIEYGTPEARIVLLPYGADPTRFAPRNVSHIDDVFRLVFCGRINIRKGVAYLLEAWKKLRLPDAELLLVGGLDAEMTRAVVTCQGVRWTGNIATENVAARFRESDVFVFPTLAEGSALVIYEAMASGLPVITTPHSGSIIRNEVDGYIVEPRDVDSLCDRMLALYRDRDLARTMGMSGRARIVNGFTWANHRKRLRRLYHNLANGHEMPTHMGPENDE